MLIIANNSYSYLILVCTMQWYSYEYEINGRYLDRYTIPTVLNFHVFTSNSIERQQQQLLQAMTADVDCIPEIQHDEHHSNVNKVSFGDGANHANKQALASSRLLHEALAKSHDVVTKDLQTNDQREAKRIHQEVNDKVKRDTVLQQLKHSPYEDECATGWQKCSESINMKDLFDLLVKQQNACELFLTKLDNIGKELGSELREKDHEYVTALKRQCQEVEEMQNCIANEHSNLKVAFERELKLIEDSLLADRSYILSTHKKELDDLVCKREEVETAHLEQQRKVIEEHRRDIAECESKGARDREELKQKFESDVRKLELELEATQAQYDVDGDALEYNYRVLSELAENEGSVKKQKKKIMKGKEERTREIHEKHQAKAIGSRENKTLEADCERIEKQAAGLKEKFARFKVSDDEKLGAVVAMNITDLRKLQIELKESQDFIFGGAIGCW